MHTQYLRESGGKLLGFIIHVGDGNKRIYDASSRLLGNYTALTDKTIGIDGAVLNGDLLVALFRR